MTDFVDPGEPGELQGTLRAGDLINLPCLLRVTGEGMWDAKPAEYNDDGSIKKRAQGPQPYLECDVAVLGASGVEQHASGVRISWTRVVPHQINASHKGRWMPARPRKQDDNSIILTAFNEQGKAAAAALLPEVEALFGPVPAEPEFDGPEDFGEEPF